MIVYTHRHIVTQRHCYALGIHIGLMAKAFILILHSEFGGEVIIEHDNVQSCL